MPGKDHRPQGTECYGGKYWCIKSEQSENGEIYVMADRLEVSATGALIAWGGYRGEYGKPEGDEDAVLILASGQWTAAYAASCMDGSAVAVERWKGEVDR